MDRVIVEILDLLNKQITLSRKIACKETIWSMKEDMNDLSLHRRDQHNSYYDSEIFWKNKRKDGEEMETLYAEFDSNQRKLIELLATLKVLPTAA